METLNKIFPTRTVRELDLYTIENEGINSLTLMERAAMVWTEFFLKFLGNRSEVVVVAGNGNNGGDGYVIARLLKARGKEVEVLRLMTGAGMSLDCEENYRLWVREGGKVVEVNGAEEVVCPASAVMVDAVFGSGLNRPVMGLAAEVIRKINEMPNPVAAVDVPSGLMGEDNAGNDRSAIVCADYTFTFQFPKLSFFLPENARYVGKWEVLDIGLSPEGIRKMPTSWYYTTLETVRLLLPQPEKFAHKGTNGRGLLIAGSYGMMGAAVLAAKAALHSGIGLLHCHVPRLGVDILQATVPEPVLDIDRSEICFTSASGLDKYDVIAVGPGIGKKPETLDGLKELLRTWPGRMILDADALNLMSEHRELLDLLHGRGILTPHIKEFERLAGKSENDFDRLNKLSIFANQFQVFVILKGAHTVIATPDGDLHFNMSGNPGLAKGGAGDVLTGVLLALAANGLDLLDVARIGVFAHGMVADVLVEEYGMRGISAGYVAEQMGKVWKILERTE